MNSFLALITPLGQAPGQVPEQPPVIWGPTDPFPTIPIVIPPPPPPSPEAPPEGSKPPPSTGGWGYSPEYGWGFFPGTGGTAGPKKGKG
jgi:hypothetical protein